MATDDKQVETRPLFVEEWVESLPYAQPISVAEALIQSLTELQDTDIKPATRFKVLELHGRAFSFLLEAREQNTFTTLTVAAFEKQRALTDAVRRSAMVLGFGYRKLAADTRSGGLLGAGKLHKLAVQRSMSLLVQTLLHLFYAYMPVPGKLWRELEQLHRDAAKLDILGDTLDSDELADDMCRPVDALYKHILLTSLVDPFHLGNDQIGEVHRITREWVPRVRIRSQLPDKQRAGLFVIDRHAETRPLPLTHLQPESIPSSCRYLDTSDALAGLNQRVRELETHAREQFDEGINPHAESLALLRRMLRDWGLPPRRHAPRNKARGTIQLASGLPALHALLSNGDALPIEIGDDDGETVLAGDADTGDGAEMLTASFNCDGWQVVDHGPTGIGVISTDKPSQLIRVGELVGIITRKQQRDEWIIGVIRWLVVKQSGEYLVGVQYIGTQPVAVVLCDERQQENNGILIGKQASGTSPALITAAGLLTAGSAVTANDGGQHSPLVMNELLERTIAFDRFHYGEAGSH